jgi:hypothetical protein
MNDGMEQINAEDGTDMTAGAETNPAGEIMISRRARIGARVSALSGAAVVTAIAITVTVPNLTDTVSSH